MKRLHQNAKTSAQILEVYLLSVKIGGIVKTLASDCRGKALLIKELIPKAIFKVEEEHHETAM